MLFVIIGALGILLITLEEPYSLPITDVIGFSLLIASFVFVLMGSMMIVWTRKETNFLYIPMSVGAVIFFSLLFALNRFDFASSILIVLILFAISGIWGIIEYRTKKKTQGSKAK